VDFISSIPLEVLLQYGFGLDATGGEARSPKLLRSLIRLVLKSARMTRMMKSFRLLEYVEEVRDRQTIVHMLYLYAYKVYGTDTKYMLICIHF